MRTHRSDRNDVPAGKALLRLSVLVASGAITALIAACGGGGDDQAPAQAQDSAKAPTASKLSVAMTGSAVTPIPPSSSEWGQGYECKDSEFVAITGSTPSTAPLRSRHTGCALLVSDPQAIQVPTMLKADGNGYELCKRSANRNCNYETAGYATFETKWQIYGINPGITKKFAMQTRLVKWEWNPAFSVGKPSLSIEVKPTIECYASALPAGAHFQKCSIMTPQSFNLNLASGSSGPKAQFDVGFAWAMDPSVGGYDVATFRVKSSGIDYKTTQADLPEGMTDLPHVYLHGGKGESWEPDVRCDRKVTGNKQGSGCVMPQAAAVFVMDSTPGNPMYEAAVHVRDAQAAAQVGMSSQAPGVYTPKPGTRAVAAEGLDMPFIPLFYSPTSDTNNRKMACDGTNDSLIKMRGYPKSATCAAGQGTCSCDEYPFATTAQGAYTHPTSTSVRMIQNADNGKGGNAWNTFLGKERVLPDHIESEPVYVYVK